MKLLTYLKQQFANGIDYSDAVQFCLGLYVAKNLIPKEIEEEGTKTRVSEEMPVCCPRRDDNMTHAIRVKNLFSANEYDSLAEAAEASARSEEDISKCKSINGQIFTGYRFNGYLLSIKFANGKYLTITPGKTSINWDVLTQEPFVDNQLKEEDIEFEFAESNVISWDWKQILDSFVGKRVAISPSDQYLFIFAKEGKEYMFNALVNKDDPEKIYLSISET